MSSALDNLNWGDNKKKVARYETIISQYRKHFGHSLPADKQYWTLCSKCVNPSGVLIEGCELFQMVKDSLIQPKQFHGVEHNTDIHHLNAQLKTDAHFYNNDFYTQMLDAYSHKIFNPAVINGDTLFMPGRGSVLLSRILFLLSCINGMNNVLVVGNFILKNPHSGLTVSPNEITRELQNEPTFKFALEKQTWQFDNMAYIYNGTGDLHRCVMGSVVFYLKK